MGRFTTIVLLLACACLVSGCSSTLRVPSGSIRPIPAEAQVDAAVRLAEVRITPTSKGAMGTSSTTHPDARPPGVGNARLWYMANSTVKLDQTAGDMEKELRRCQLFQRGFVPKGTPADLEMNLELSIGGNTRKSDVAFMFTVFLLTVNMYPLFGGPVPTATIAEMVCELAPADREGPTKIYKSQAERREWGPPQTLYRRDNRIATRLVTNMLNDIVGQITKDKNHLQLVAEGVRTRRKTRLAPPVYVAARPPPPTSVHPARAALPADLGPIKGRWALIIGVSKYRDKKVSPLPYAGADAKALHDWLLSPAGGGYAPERVKLLLDEQATGAALREGFFEWLKQPIAEDMITVFYAGHGSPESPDSPQNLYLLPYDVDYDKIAATAFPMWDIETALKRHIKARRVIIIADACHSAGVGEQFDIARRSNRGLRVAPVTKALESVGAGVCVLSASDTAQMSQEGEQWGGGHGVFSYHLLEGLKGKADINRDSRVTVGELVPYISESVRRATKSAQCPQVSGKYDPAMSIQK